MEKPLLFVYNRTMSKIKQTKKRKFEPVTGNIEKHARGFGFLRQEEGSDIYIAPDNMAGAMNGDLVEVDMLQPY